MFIVLPKLFFAIFFIFALMLDDLGFLMSHLPIILTPLTSTVYLNMRVEIIVVPWNLQALIVDILANNHGNASMSLN